MRSASLWIKDRVECSAKEAKGAVKEAAGKVSGDAHLRNERCSAIRHFIVAPRVDGCRRDICTTANRGARLIA
jgi:hypothetical protein